MSHLKIAFVVDDTLDKPDGVQQYILALGAWLTAQGHIVHYLAGASSRSDVLNIHSLSRNVSVKFNGNRLSIPLPANSKAIKDLLVREQYDVIHVQMPYSPMLAHKVIMLAPAHTAVVGTFHIMPHGRAASAGTHLLGRWTASSLRRFNKIYAVSEVAKDFAETAFRLRGVEVLPNVVDVARFGVARRRKELVGGKPVVMFLGRLVPRKGCGTFLEALAILHERGVAFRGVVCGKGALLDELQARSRRMGLEALVEFTGFVSEADKPSYMKSADVIAYPSVGGESFGIVLIEAMATGRPVVLAGDNPGYRSVMGSRPQLLFPAKDATVLADKLQHYLTDKQAAQGVVAWQNKHVLQYDTAAVGKQLLAAYLKLRAAS